eukprot:TRINITY_DN14588_c0_g1_i2.p5 TRINITY_DN14588_c0_g1~~TRINITY_DN14588_c0_g1_i2.p5  ORF type:complete len:107 (+),score=4.16 TRINITY_DN14588_c0_g1_i2:566-886(+)
MHLFTARLGQQGLLDSGRACGLEDPVVALAPGMRWRLACHGSNTTRFARRLASPMTCDGRSVRVAYQSEPPDALLVETLIVLGLHRRCALSWYRTAEFRRCSIDFQ